MTEFLIYLASFGMVGLFCWWAWRTSQRLRAQDAASAVGAGSGQISHQAHVAPPSKSAPRPQPPVAVMPAAPVVTPATIPATPEAAAAQTAAPPPALSLERTLRALTDSLHLMLVGESNAGKSTAAEAVLAARVQAGDQVLILDPHADPTIWRGLPAVGTGRDYAAIAVAMERLLAEMSDRYQRKAAGDTSYPPVSLFIDEWPAIQLHCKNAGAFMAQMAQEARKVGMRLVVLTQSDRVESLGLSGKGDVRENFTMLLLGNKATAAIPETARMSRPGAIRRGAQLVPATVDGLDQVPSSAALGASVVYDVPIIDQGENLEGAAIESFDLDAELARALAILPPVPGAELIDGNSVPELAGAENTAGTQDGTVPAVPVPGHQNELKSVPANLPRDKTSRAIRALLAADFTRTEIIEQLSLGRKADGLKRIKIALGEVEEVAA